MKRIKLKEGAPSSELFFNWPATVQDNRLNHPSEIETFLEETLTENDELLGYYTNMLITLPEHKEFFDYELRSRNLDIYIAPDSHELDYYSNPQKITRDLVVEVAKAKDFEKLFRTLRSFYGVALNARLCAALLVAICLDRKDLITAIKGHINKINTFKAQAKTFIEKNATEAMAERVIELYTEYVNLLQAR